MKITRTKAILFFILFLVVMVFVITEISIRLNDKPAELPEAQISQEEIDRQNTGGDGAYYEEAQGEEEANFVDESDVLEFAEVEPEYPGGEEAMIRFIQQNVVYPEYSREMGEQGTVYVGFVVDTDGTIQNVKILKGVSPLLDNEAARVVRKMPKWNPGKQNGEHIRVRFTIPIKFSIQ